MGRKRADWPASGFGARLKHLRESAGLTQMAVAVKAKVSLSGYTKLEQGVVEPTWPMVIALARAIDVEVGDFLPTESTEVSAEPEPPNISPAEQPKPKRGRPRKDATEPEETQES